MNAKEIKHRLKTGQPVEKWQLATLIEQQELYIKRLHKLCNANGLGIGRNLLTGEIIPFEVEE